MSDRIFVRRYCDPLKPPRLTDFRKRVGKNSGNLIFASSAQRSVMVDGVDVEARGLSYLVAHVERMNDEGRHVVIPLANAFRPGFRRNLIRLTDAIERLTVPVTILGVGGQFDLHGESIASAGVDEAAQRFLRAVLERGPSIGVRGERTAAYLARLGFTEVEVIGCPSMFLRGPDLRIRSAAPAFDDQTRVTVNLVPQVPIPTGWIDDVIDRHPRTEFVGQELIDLDAMLGGPPVKAVSSDYPSSVRHRLIAESRAVFHQHAPTWIDSMRQRDFTLGHRIHGNIASLLAGTPAHVIVHDSRTAELCEYFEIPHTSVRDHTRELMPQDFYERSDYTALVANHPERLMRFAGFLEHHGLRHVLDLPAGEAPYDRAVARVPVREDLIIRPRGRSAELVDERWRHLTALHEELARAKDRPVGLAGRIEQNLTRRGLVRRPR